MLYIAPHIRVLTKGFAEASSELMVLLSLGVSIYLSNVEGGRGHQKVPALPLSYSVILAKQFYAP